MNSFPHFHFCEISNVCKNVLRIKLGNANVFYVAHYTELFLNDLLESQ